MNEEVIRLAQNSALLAVRLAANMYTGTTLDMYVIDKIIEEAKNELGITI